MHSNTLFAFGTVFQGVKGEGGKAGEGIGGVAAGGGGVS